MLNQPILQPDPFTTEYVLIQRYEQDLTPWGVRLIVEPGYRQNGFSEPIWAAGIAGFTSGDARVLAVSQIHDPLYEAELLPRDVCDDILKWAMKQNCAESAGFAEAAWFFVHMFGGSVWSQHTPASMAKARMFARIEKIGDRNEQ